MNVTLEDILKNSTNAYMIPDEYRDKLESLQLEYKRIKDSNATEDLLAWNVTDFKNILEFYIDYHNKVAE